MSSRALRRLREEKEAAALLATNEEGDDEEEESSEEEEEGAGKTGGGGFAMMLDDSDESSSEEESSSDEDEDESGSENKKADELPAPVVKSKKGNKTEPKEEEDLDAILSDMNIQSSTHDNPDGTTTTPTTAIQLPTIRSFLLAKQKGFDAQDLDLDYSMRSLVGGQHGALGGGGDDGMPQPPNQQGNRRQRGNQNNPRGRRTLAKRYLFGKPKVEWGKPPSYVGGGLGVKELTPQALEEERHSWSIPWPYNLQQHSSEDGGEAGDENNHDVDILPTTIPSTDNQKWYTLQMSDTYKEQDYMYQELLHSTSANTSHRSSQGMHDPNSLAMFVADHPYFAETILQLGMVLYYINDRVRGNDLVRRCMFLYESALPGNILPSNNSSGSNDNDDDTTAGDGSNAREILIDIERNTQNSGLFATLFRIMQTSGMTGCYNNALSTGRYLLSLDPLRDPMGVLLILDYYALASRRTSSSYKNNKSGASPSCSSGGVRAVGVGEENSIEVGAAFIVDLIEMDYITIHYKDPLTDRHYWCNLMNMPNWAYSYALALYRLSIAVEEDEGDDGNPDEGEGEGEKKKSYRERAEDAMTNALQQFPMVLPKLLAMNKVNTRDRSFRMDWPAILPMFTADEESGNDATTTVEQRVTRASGEHLVRIFVQRCHKFWKEDHVVQWMYQCAAKVVEERNEKANNAEAASDSSGLEAIGEATLSPAVETEGGATSSDANKASKNAPPMTSEFSPALARYAQCDPSEYEDAFHTFPPEAIALDPNIVAPAMALGPNGRRGRFLRRGQQQQQRGRMENGADGQDPLEAVRQLLGMQGNGGQEVEVLDPDSPILQLYLQSLLPWAQVEGVRPPPRG